MTLAIGFGQRPRASAWNASSLELIVPALPARCAAIASSSTSRVLTPRQAGGGVARTASRSSRFQCAASYITLASCSTVRTSARSTIVRATVVTGIPRRIVRSRGSRWLQRRTRTAVDPDLAGCDDGDRHARRPQQMRQSSAAGRGARALPRYPPRRPPPATGPPARARRARPRRLRSGSGCKSPRARRSLAALGLTPIARRSCRSGRGRAADRRSRRSACRVGPIDWVSRDGLSPPVKPAPPRVTEQDATVPTLCLLRHSSPRGRELRRS